jgi:hypothetical protein
MLGCGGIVLGVQQQLGIAAAGAGMTEDLAYCSADLAYCFVGKTTVLCKDTERQHAAQLLHYIGRAASARYFTAPVTPYGRCS